MTARRKIQYWLFKEEPGHYSYEDLEKDQRTVWDGVTNNLAQKHLRSVCKGDRALYYHTGKEKAVVGEMIVVSEPRPAEDNDRRVVVDVEPVRRLSAVTLSRIKEEAALREWDLVRIPRLSIVPMTSEQWKQIITMSNEASKEE